MWQGYSSHNFDISGHTTSKCMHMYKAVWVSKMEDSFFSCQIISEFEEADADYLSNLQSTEADSASSLMEYEDEHTCMIR